jgi:hypothetical protein
MDDARIAVLTGPVSLDSIDRVSRDRYSVTKIPHRSGGLPAAVGYP